MLHRFVFVGERHLLPGLVAAALILTARPAKGEAMLELFQQTWPQITQKIPELAEAGYDSLWLPNPCKGNSGAYDTGYAPFDAFDLGSSNQAGSIATFYGTQDQLIRMVQTAHRFGIRIYFDDVMNHRGGTVPGYPGSGTATNYYPGLIPQDFHLQVVSGGYKNWDNVSDWCNPVNVEENPLLGLLDLANEPGTVNRNYGSSYLGTITKPSFIRLPNRPDLYMDTNGPLLGAGWGNGWHPFDGHGQPVAEDVSIYLCRAVAWTLYTTKCDGFRLDAVKHVPVAFFGNETGQTDDPTFAGYTGAIQAMYDYVHGFGSNATGNGYLEADGNRNSLFNTETTRNDAMVFGEYIPSALSQSEDFYDYLNSGMRLLNQPLYNYLNGVFESGSTMTGMDSPYFTPPCSNCNCDGNGNFSMNQAVNMPQTQDSGTCCPANQGMEDAYFFMHEGLPMVYSDGFNHNTSGGTPIASFANYLGEFGDNSMPEIMYLHNQLSRGGTWPRWHDQNIAAFERYDYREGNGSEPWTQDVVLFAMNDNAGNPGDEYFCDGADDVLPPSYAVPGGANGDLQGMVVNFPIGAVLHQLATTTPGYSRTFQTITVRPATNNKSAASSSTVYVGSQTIPAGGGAVEFMIPSDGWVMYGYQWPEASRANLYTNAITLRQGGAAAPSITIQRHDGPNGQSTYSPLFPFKMRGSVDQYGNVVMLPGEGNVANLTYAIDVPVVTNAAFDILIRSDSSTGSGATNTLVKLDGGIDLNSQMGLGPTTFQAGIAPTNFLDLRDNKPGYASDVFLGYEQTALQFRDNPEKFAAKNTLSNTIVSLGAETYYYTIGSTNTLVVPGSAYGQSVDQTAAFIYHDPAAPVTATGEAQATQRVPYNPASNQSADIYVKIGYTNYVNSCFLYYTTDGSNPEGAFGVGKGTTQVVPAAVLAGDASVSTIVWWKVTLPAQPAGTQVRYKVGTFYGGSSGGASGAPISDADSTGAKYYGVTQAAITNFNPATAVVWTHNDLNPANTATGLQPGFHILRARVSLPRTGQSSVYNTFLQTFYYDGGLPTGVIAYPSGGTTISSGSYTVVVRADNTVTEADYNIQNTVTNNWDIYTHLTNGIGNDTNGNPIYVAAGAVTANQSLNLTYTNYPQEFRFAYTNIPGSGTGTINVRLKEYGTTLYTNHVTNLSAPVITAAPSQVIDISRPATDGTVLSYTNNTIYQISACFSTSLNSSTPTNFNVLINGVLQPQGNYSLHATGPCSGMKVLYYNWTNPPVGTNVIQVIYTNATIAISGSRSVTVAPPLKIAALGGNDSQLVLWNSAPGVNYAVLATTNLSQPFQNLSGTIPSQGSTTLWYDPNLTVPQKFYQIELVQ